MSKDKQKHPNSANIDTYLDTYSGSSLFNNDDNIDSRSYFLNIVEDFPIDLFNIPRPFKTMNGNEEIADDTCVMIAFTLLDVPHDSFINNIAEPKGWLSGNHLLIYDWNLAFGGSTLIQQLKMNPWSLITDSPAQLAVSILKSKFQFGTPRESKMAKGILEEANLNFLISSEYSRKRTKDINLRYYENYPMYLKAAISFYEYIIRKYFDNNISEAFNKIFNKKMPKEISEGDSGSTSINIALAFVSYEVNVEFSTLRVKFYDRKRGINKEIKEIKLYEFPDYIDTIIVKDRVDKDILENYKKELDKTNLHLEQPLLY